MADISFGRVSYFDLTIVILLLTAYTLKKPSISAQLPILYSSYASDTSWRVRIALAWKGIEYEARYIDIDAGEHVSWATDSRMTKIVTHISIQ